MAESSIGAETVDVLGIDAATFRSRVEEDAETIKAEIEAGTFDNALGNIGFEYEFYAVTDPDVDRRRGTPSDGQWGDLRRVPRTTLSLIGFEKELGLHNAEMNTSPQPFNDYGLAAQEAEVCARLAAAHDRTRADDIRLVSDAMWTIPPAGETARHYLTDSVTDGGVTIATNMADSARYHAMANTDAPAGMRIEAPNVTVQADTVMPESLITSIQPHYQVPAAHDLPTYFGYALRIAGPLLALGVNSPFFPPDLYDPGVDPDRILEEAWMEHRISVFETTLNTDGIRKVRFPRDIDRVEQAVDRIVADDTFVPMPVEPAGRFDDDFAYFRRKHGTYWRWIRPVFEGITAGSAHARIEFRPISSQPTVRDSIAFQAAFAGALEGLFTQDHPVETLDWRDARENFYAAMRAGIGADLDWITADGEATTDADALYDDLLETAATGLRTQGLGEERVAHYLGPLRFRVRHRLTPARWKHRLVAREVEGHDAFEDAIYGMQRSYIDHQARTLLDGTFEDWVEV